MADTEVASRPRIDRFIIRSWPKIILMLPTLFMALVCGGIMSFQPAPAPDASFGWLHLVGLLFLLVLMINLTLLLYDLSLRGFLIIALGILVFVLTIFLLNRYVEGGAWRAIGEALSVRVYANAAFYFTFAFVLFFNLAIAWIQTRFHFWVIERNEIIIHRGYMAEQERHPTAQTRFKLVIDDVVEYGLLRSGKLVFIFGDNHSEHVLDTVLCVHRKAKVLDDLLGRVAVTEQ
ncbi:MAG TPA: hypothetical protein PKY77_15825 [Phycisphaerae bacterium]|nr:hypothetical protein [Phycisphaerae bacterium]HRY70725.1 hypothetical protein [Phycisphaerae bacterium]HSA28759.1 hypothetical protein [Phycisphaerae bacterium]